MASSQAVGPVQLVGMDAGSGPSVRDRTQPLFYDASRGLLCGPDPSTTIPVSSLLSVAALQIERNVQVPTHRNAVEVALEEGMVWQQQSVSSVVLVPRKISEERRPKWTDPWARRREGVRGDGHGGTIEPSHESKAP